MRYLVLMPSLPQESHGAPADRGSNWQIVEAENPTKAVEKVYGVRARTDDKVLIVPLNEDPVPVYAKVEWSQ